MGGRDTRASSTSTCLFASFVGSGLRCSIAILAGSLAAHGELIVDFGATPGENAFGLPGWDGVVQSTGMQYSSEGGGGLIAAGPESDRFAHYFGAQGSGYRFEPGDEIVATFYNSTPNRLISYEWYPLMSLEDHDGPDSTAGQPQWFIMEKRYFCESCYYNSQVAYLHIDPGETEQVMYVVTDSNSAPGESAPTAGFRDVVTICVNAPSMQGLVCDRIELFRATETCPAVVQNVRAVLNPRMPYSSVRLSWDASQEFVHYYRINRDGYWVDKTQDTAFIDYNLNCGTTYSYTIQAVRNRLNMSDAPAPVSIKTEDLPSDTELINPRTDLVHLGAFRFPAVFGPGMGSWRGRRGDIAYYPPGDPHDVDGDTEHPGSIYGFGREGNDAMVSEISIPQPVISRDFESLPRAQELQPFHGIWPANRPTSSLPRHHGLAYVPQTGLFYTVFNDYYNYSGAKRLSHGSFGTDFSNVQGLWYVGDPDPSTPPRYYSYASYAGAIPHDWAELNAPGRYLMSGAIRGNGPHGPGLTAIQAPQAPFPQPGEGLGYTSLIEYGTSDNGPTMNGFMNIDSWKGVAWVHAGDRSAVVVTGEKGFGEFYYGFDDGTRYVEYFKSVPRIEVHNPQGNRGGRTRGRKGMMLFYDPDQLAGVARGELTPDRPQPYAALTPDEDLVSYDGANGNKWYTLGSVTFDRERSLLYVVEAGLPDDEDAIHVYRVGEPGPAAFGLPPPGHGREGARIKINRLRDGRRPVIQVSLINVDDVDVSLYDAIGKKLPCMPENGAAGVRDVRVYESRAELADGVYIVVVKGRNCRGDAIRVHSQFSLLAR